MFDALVAADISQRETKEVSVENRERPRSALLRYTHISGPPVLVLTETNPWTCCTTGQADTLDHLLTA